MSAWSSRHRSRHVHIYVTGESSPTFCGVRVLKGALNRHDLAHGRPVVLVSHGFQHNYERGFTNGLDDTGVAATLVSSDRTDYAGLRPDVHTVNLRGSQEERRPKWAKALGMLRYHLGLCAYTLWRRRAVWHVIGLIYPPLLYGVIEGLWFRAVCWRYVLTVHDLLPHDRHTRANHLLNGLSFRLAHRLVVHTDRMRDELIRRFGVRPERVTVMEHGIEPLASPLVAVPATDANRPMRLLFFGKVTQYKGLDVLLDALQTTSMNFSLMIAGFCLDKTLEHDLRARIAAHRAVGSITWRNEFIPEAEIEGLFSHADVLVLPYRHIDQSGVLFQALRYGVPVVASRVGSFTQYVTDDIGETCPPDNADELRCAIERIHERRTELSRERIVEIGRSYEWHSTVQALAAAYS